MKRISAVIVTYNDQKYLDECLDNFCRQTRPIDEIIIIDNNSQDQTRQKIKDWQVTKKLPIKTILNQGNTGFALANNQGMREALKNGADYIFLHNQDAIMDENCLAELEKAAEKENNLFALQPLIISWKKYSRFPANLSVSEGQEFIQTSGDRIHFLGFGYCGDFCLPYNAANVSQLVSDIPYASGAALFMSAKALEEIGLLDEDLFMYHEDMELNWRARLLGKKIKLAKNALFYHRTESNISPFKWYWSERNRELLLFEFYKWPTLLLIFPFWLIMEIGSLMYSLWIGALKLKIKSYFDFFKLYPLFSAKRKKIQQLRIITEREMADYLDSTFNFAGLQSPVFYIINPFFGFAWKIIKKIMVW
jgi:hypothetical protein